MNGYGCTSIFSKTYKMHPEKNPALETATMAHHEAPAGRAAFPGAAPRRLLTRIKKKVGAWGALGARCRDLGYGGDLMGFIGIYRDLMGFNGI
jgi:hypothetical protein